MLKSTDLFSFLGSLSSLCRPNVLAAIFHLRTKFRVHTLCRGKDCAIFLTKQENKSALRSPSAMLSMSKGELTTASQHPFSPPKHNTGFHGKICSDCSVAPNLSASGTKKCNCWRFGRGGSVFCPHLGRIPWDSACRFATGACKYFALFMQDFSQLLRPRQRFFTPIPRIGSQNNLCVSSTLNWLWCRFR